MKQPQKHEASGIPYVWTQCYLALTNLLYMRQSHYFLCFSCPYYPVLRIFCVIFLFSLLFSIKMVSQLHFYALTTFRLRIPALTVIIETWVLP